MVFGTNTRIAILIFILLSIAYSFIGYLGNDIYTVSLDGFLVESISNVSEDSFYLQGSFYLNNPSGLILPVRSIVFDVFLDGEQISKGNIISFRLGANQVSRVGFEKKINHNLNNLNLSSRVSVEGRIIVDFLFVDPHIISFSDVKQLSEIVPEELLYSSDDGLVLVLI
jgi:LEA14-like dessication related protein